MKKKALFELSLMLGEQMYLLRGCMRTKQEFPEYEIPKVLTDKIEAIEKAIKAINK